MRAAPSPADSVRTLARQAQAIALALRTAPPAESEGMLEALAHATTELAVAHVATVDDVATKMAMLLRRLVAFSGGEMMSYEIETLQLGAGIMCDLVILRDGPIAPALQPAAAPAQQLRQVGRRA